MGLGDVRIVSPEKVSQALRCAICTEVFVDPVFSGGAACQHAFCRACISMALDRRQRCPTCRAALTRRSLRPHLVIRELLDELQVRCEAGCAWTGRQDAHAAHAAACPAKLLEAARTQLTEQAARFDAQARQLDEARARLHEARAQLLELDRLRARLPQRDARIQELEAELARARRGMESGAKRKFAMLQAEAADKLAKVVQDMRIAADSAERGAASPRRARGRDTRGDPAVPMQIFVRTAGGATITVDAEPDHTIACVKSMVRDKCGVPPDAFYLTLAGKPLEDSQSVGALGISKETTLTMCMRVSVCRWGEIDS